MYISLKRIEQGLLLIFICCGLQSCNKLKEEITPTDLFKGNLIDNKGQSSPDDALANSDLILLYFSASWCPPCRKFTPKLVEFYQQNSGGTYFEVLLISSDHSEKKMLNYMRTTGMPWQGIRYRSQGAKVLASHYSGDGIPRLVLINQDGQVLADSYKGKKYIGPDHVLHELKKMLTEKELPTNNPDAEQILDQHPAQNLKTLNKLRKKYLLDGLGKGSQGYMAIINGKPRTTGEQLEEDVFIYSIGSNSVIIGSKKKYYKLLYRKIIDEQY